jgi:hypothetical protein
MTAVAAATRSWHSQPSDRRPIIWRVMAIRYSPSELREMREALRAFREAYVAYIDRPSREAKAVAVRAMPEAELALHAGGGGVTLLDPPAMGYMRQQHRGLAQTAFIHETGWGQVDGREPYELVLDGMDSVDAVLAAEERRLAKLRRRPTYWLDRAVRTALMPAAYVVSVILGESAFKIDHSALGIPLRLLSVAADVSAIYFAGVAFRWW